MMFRTYLLIASLATALYGYGQYLGYPALGSAGLERATQGHQGGRLYHK